MVVDIATIVKILRALAEKDGITVTELIKRAHLSYSTASKYIPLMEQKRLIRVESRGRKKVIYITEHGLRVLAAGERFLQLLNMY